MKTNFIHISHQIAIVSGEIEGRVGNERILRAHTGLGAITTVTDKGYKKGDIVEETYADGILQIAILNGKEIFNIKNKSK